MYIIYSQIPVKTTRSKYLPSVIREATYATDTPPKTMVTIDDITFH